MDRKRKILIVLLIIFVAAVIYRVLHPFRQKRIEHLTYTSHMNRPEKRRPGENMKTPGSGDMVVMSNLMKNVPKHSGKVINELFFKPFPKNSRKDTPSAAPDDSFMEPPEDNLMPAPEKADPMKKIYEDLEKLKIIGLYSSGPDRAIFFKRGKQTIVARKGDIIDGKYKIEDITADKIVFRAKQPDKEISVDLTPFLKPYERGIFKENR